MKTLIIRFSAMGDVAMTSPVIAAAGLEHPEEEFVLLTQKWLTPLFLRLPNVQPVGISFDDYKGITGLIRLYRQLRKGRFDRVLDLHDVLRTKVLVLLFRMGGTRCYVIDKGRKEKRDLVGGKKKRQLKTTVERYADVFREAGLSFALPQKAEKSLLPLPEIFDSPKTGRWWGIAPFAKHRGKSYDLDRSRRLIELLAQNPDDRVFIFSGGGEEQKVSEEIASKYSNVETVFGKVKLDGEMALMSNLDALISMDSGAMHIASIVGCRVVSVWGATHPLAGFLGYGQKESDAIGLNLECRPCSVYGNKKCSRGNYPCLDIEPEIIYETVMV